MTKKAGMNPAKSIQVPTLEFVIMENTAKMTPTEGIACGDCHSLNGYPIDTAKITNYVSTTRAESAIRL